MVGVLNGRLPAIGIGCSPLDALPVHGLLLHRDLGRCGNLMCRCDLPRGRDCHPTEQDSENANKVALQDVPPERENAPSIGVIGYLPWNTGGVSPMSLCGDKT